MGLCEPWVTGAEVLLRPGMDGMDTLLVDQAAAEASALLFALSGRRFPGLCSIEVRPAARPRSSDEARWTDQLAMSGFPFGFSNTWGICNLAHNDFGGSCARSRSIDLVHFPVREVTEVLIDGVVLDNTGGKSYRVDDLRTLVRVDGGLWPTCQRLDLPATAAGTFAVTYTFGDDPPADGIEAATTLAAELAKYHANKPHKLPTRITSIVRQDVSMTVIDPMQFLGRKGDMPLTGIWEVDLFIRTANPNGQQLPPLVWSPDRMPPHTTGTYVAPTP